MQNNTLITLLLSVFIALLGIGIIVSVMPVSSSELGAGGFAQMVVVYLCMGTVESAIMAVLGAYALLEAKRFYGHGTMMGVFSLARSAGVFTGAMLARFSMDSLGIEWAYYVTGSAVLLLSVLAVVMIGMHDRKYPLTEAL